LVEIVLHDAEHISPLFEQAAFVEFFDLEAVLNFLLTLPESARQTQVAVVSDQLPEFERLFHETFDDYLLVGGKLTLLLAVAEQVSLLRVEHRLHVRVEVQLVHLVRLKFFYVQGADRATKFQPKGSHHQRAEQIGAQPGHPHVRKLRENQVGMGGEHNRQHRQLVCH